MLPTLYLGNALEAPFVEFEREEIYPFLVAVLARGKLSVKEAESLFLIYWLDGLNFCEAHHLALMSELETVSRKVLAGKLASFDEAKAVLKTDRLDADLAESAKELISSAYFYAKSNALCPEVAKRIIDFLDENPDWWPPKGADLQSTQ